MMHALLMVSKKPLISASRYPARRPIPDAHRERVKHILRVLSGVIRPQNAATSPAQDSQGRRKLFGAARQRSDDGAVLSMFNK